MKLSCTAILALLGGTAHGANLLRAPSLYPQVVSIQTTRQVASDYAPYLDILKGQSRRHANDDNDWVQLNVVLHGQEQTNVLKNLQANGVLTVMDTQRRHLQEGTFDDLTCYRTLDETFATMDRLVDEYPDFATTEDIGESWKMMQDSTEGYPIKVLVISAPSSVEKHDMLVVGGHHSRELPPPETLLRWAEMLLEKYGSDADITWILERTNIHIVPFANPDGRAYVQDHLDWYYRKNAHTYGCEEGIARDGVDLNRNWPMFWGQDIGSSNETCSNAFRGEAPLSEPESAALYNYFKSLFPESVSKGSVENAMERQTEACPVDTPGLFIDVHSSGDFIYFPWGLFDQLSPNHLPLLTMAAKLSMPGNYSLWGPGQDGFLYFVSGDATDTAYGIDCIASFGYEVGTEWYEPCDLYETSTLPVVYESLLYAAKTVSAPYKIPLGPDVLSITTEWKNETGVLSLMLTATVSDVQNIVDHAVFPSADEKSQNIQHVLVYVDVHPYDSDGAQAAMNMNPLDGSFDVSTEVATLELPGSDWTAGRHVLYVEGVDADGNRGAISAVFVDLEEDQDGSDSGDDPASSLANIGLGFSFVTAAVFAGGALIM